LLKQHKNWKKSKLKKEHGILDLIDLMNEFHHQFIKNYGSFVASTFFPELRRIDAFYRKLTQEVQAKFPESSMVFLTNRHETKEKNRITVNFTVISVPNAVFDELGIGK